MPRIDRHGGGLLALAVLIAVAVVVPYGAIGGYATFLASFTFWLVFGATSVGVILWLLRGWRV